MEELKPELIKIFFSSPVIAWLNEVATVVHSNRKNTNNTILGDPGATSRDDVIFSGKSLLQELKSPWELTLTEPVPEVVEFSPTDWAEKYFSGQSAKASSRVTLSPSYTK